MTTPAGMRRLWSSGAQQTPIENINVTASVESALGAKQAEHDAIEEHVDAFLAAGGEIEVIPSGTTAYAPNGKANSNQLVIDYRRHENKGK